MQALEFIQGLRWESQVLAPPGAPQDWTKEQAAIYEMGSWRLVDFLGLQSDGTPKLSFKWNVFPMSIGPSGERATLATNDAYAINRQTQHLDEAWELLKFLAGPRANEVLAKYLALQPAHRDVVPEYISLMRELNRDAYDIDVHVFTDAGPYAYPKLYYAQPDLAEGVLADAYTRIFDNREPVGSVWSEAIERMNRLLATAARSTGPQQVAWAGAQWTAQDINAKLPGGAQVREDGALVVSASGSDIWSYQDGMHFVYQEAAGDVTVTVRLHSAATTNAWSKSGIMVRASDNAGAANANGEPVYLRLIRQGQRVTGQYSVDGSTWTNLATVDVDLPEQVLVGIASTAHNTALVGDAVFTEWTME